MTDTKARAAATAEIRGAGAEPQEWSNSPGVVYAEHQHGYRKLLFCIAGSITFHTDAGDRQMKPGDRLDLPAGTRHSATVGPAGVTCIEGAVR